MTHTIPQQTIIECDVCGVDCTGGKSRAKGAKLTLNRNALDHLGNAAADGTVSFDLCDDCESVVSRAINQAAEGRRKGKPQ